MFCNKCGNEIADEALICPYCGCGTVNYVRDQAKAEARASVQAAPQPLQKKRSVALLLCLFLGCLGAHRFYVGKIGTGILWLCTLGFGGIGALIDLIMIIDNKFTDSFGAALYDEYTANMTQEEYDAAAACPRKVRKIVLIVAVALCLLCLLVLRVIPGILDLIYA